MFLECLWNDSARVIQSACRGPQSSSRALQHWTLHDPWAQIARWQAFCTTNIYIPNMWECICLIQTTYLLMWWVWINNKNISNQTPCTTTYKNNKQRELREGMARRHEWVTFTRWVCHGFVSKWCSIKIMYYIFFVNMTETIKTQALKIENGWILVGCFQK